MTKTHYRNATGIFSTQLAVGSFAIGTLLLILHLIFPNGELLLIGFIYLALAIILNLMMFIYLVYLFLTQRNHQEYYTIKILILLANIPVAFVYFKIATESYKL